MDAREKVLMSLIDTMHEQIAKGHGSQKVNPTKELAKAAESVEEEAPAKEKQESLFDKFLKGSANRNKQKAVEMTMIATKASPPKKAKK